MPDAVCGAGEATARRGRDGRACSALREFAGGARSSSTEPGLKRDTTRVTGEGDGTKTQRQADGNRRVLSDGSGTPEGGEKRPGSP